MNFKAWFYLAILPLCASCIIKPGYRKDLHSPLFEERTGRLFESTRHLGTVAETSADAWVDSCIGADVPRLLGVPCYFVANMVLCPAWDVLRLPSDLYVRNFDGATIRVCHADGTPIRNAEVVAYEERRLHRREVGPFRTDPDGLVHIPRKRQIVRIKDFVLPAGSLDETFPMVFGSVQNPEFPVESGIPDCSVVLFERGLSYAPLRHRIQASTGSSAESLPLCRSISVDLASGRMLPSSARTEHCFQCDWHGTEIRFRFFSSSGAPLPVCRVENSVTNLVPDAGRKIFASPERRVPLLSYSAPRIEDILDHRKRIDLQWDRGQSDSLHPSGGERADSGGPSFPGRIRQGLQPGEAVLFQTGDRFGLVTELYLEYGGDLTDPILHMSWLFNVEPEKDWFDLDGIPVKAGIQTE